jgi:hypothetical protein
MDCRLGFDRKVVSAENVGWLAGVQLKEGSLK